MAIIDFDRILADSFIEQIRYHDTIESTNSDSLEFCRSQSHQSPLLVIAAEQTAGRGRGSNQWWSAEGALTFTVVIEPARLGLDERQWPKASLATGVAICAALQQLAEMASVTLKWPNDVYLNGQKVCGVLVEVGGAVPRSQLAIGIGLNVNNSFRDAPAELQQTATSLIDSTGQPFALADVLLQVLQQLEHHLQRLSSDDSDLVSDWQDRCYLQGRSVELQVGQRTVNGVCQGIDDEGALVILASGGLERFFGGVVSRIW